MGHLVGVWPQIFGSRKCCVGLCAAVLLSGLFTSLALHVQDVTHHWSFCPEVTQKYVTNPQEMEPIRSHLGDNPNIGESYPADSCGRRVLVLYVIVGKGCDSQPLPQRHNNRL